MKSAHFWLITQQIVVISYRRFGTSYRSLLRVQESKKKKVLTTEDGNEKLSQNFGNYHYSLGNNPEERSSYLNKQLEPATYVITANGNRLFLYVYSIITD